MIKIFKTGELVDLAIPTEDFALNSEWYDWFNRPELTRYLYWGDFKNGYPEGFGILKDTNGIFIGQWKEGEPHGKGKQISKEGNSWEGVYINGSLQGLVTHSFKGEILFKGQYKNDVAHGKGVNIGEVGKYRGEIANGLYHGYGSLAFTDGELYEGEFLNGSFDGQGSYTFRNGTKWVGEFENNKMVGEGIFHTMDGRSELKDWKDDYRNPEGMTILCEKNNFWR